MEIALEVSLAIATSQPPSPTKAAEEAAEEGAGGGAEAGAEGGEEESEGRSRADLLEEQSDLALMKAELDAVHMAARRNEKRAEALLGDLTPHKAAWAARVSAQQARLDRLA